MRKSILTIQEAIECTQQLKKEGKTIIVAGGCFDILHSGHIAFLEASKKEGDFLFLLLESDETIQHLKGANRPINRQKDRAYILSNIRSVDYIVLLTPLYTNQAYDDILYQLKPDVITTTTGDLYKEHKERQAQSVNARLVEVVKRVHNKSTSTIAKMLEKEI